MRLSSLRRALWVVLLTAVAIGCASPDSNLAVDEVSGDGGSVRDDAGRDDVDGGASRTDAAAPHEEVTLLESDCASADHMAAYGSNPVQKYDVYTPAGPVDPTRGAVVVFHGGSWWGGNRCAKNLIDLARTKLNPAGYVVFSVGYRRIRKTWDGETPANAPDDVASLDLVMADAVKALATIRSRAGAHQFDPDKMATLGASAGSTLALYSASKVPGIKLAISLAGFPAMRLLATKYNKEGAGQNDHPIDLRNASALVKYVVRYDQAKVSGSEAAWWAAVDPMDHVATAPPATLLLHNAQDSYTHPGMTAEYIEAMRKAGKVVRAIAVAESYTRAGEVVAPHANEFYYPELWADDDKNGESDAAQGARMQEHYLGYLAAAFGKGAVPAYAPPTIAFAYRPLTSTVNVTVTVEGSNFANMQEAPYSQLVTLEKRVGGAWVKISSKRLAMVFVSSTRPAAQATWYDLARGSELRASILHDSGAAPTMKVDIAP